MRTRMDKISALSATECAKIIDEWIVGHNATRNRKILKRYLIDGDGYERIAEEFDLSRNQVQAIVVAGREKLCEKI